MTLNALSGERLQIPGNYVYFVSRFPKNPHLEQPVLLSLSFQFHSQFQ